MGSILQYVEDSALRSCTGATCHHCERDDVPIYGFHGEIINPVLAHDPELARRRPEVDELCANCINGGNIRRINHSEVSGIVAKFAADSSVAWREFNKLPNIPRFMQGFDWPMCCGGWCEFVGSPTSLRDLVTLQAAIQYWDRGPAIAPRSFRDEGPPESMEEVSIFRCFRCRKRYYIDQFS